MLEYDECSFFVMWRLVGLVRTKVSEERVASIFRAERIQEVGMLAINNCFMSIKISLLIWRF
jgi:hypothetical protein